MQLKSISWTFRETQPSSDSAKWCWESFTLNSPQTISEPSQKNLKLENAIVRLLQMHLFKCTFLSDETKFIIVKPMTKACWFFTPSEFKIFWYHDNSPVSLVLSSANSKCWYLGDNFPVFWYFYLPPMQNADKWWYQNLLLFFVGFASHPE